MQRRLRGSKSLSLEASGFCESQKGFLSGGILSFVINLVFTFNPSLMSQFLPRLWLSEGGR